MPTVEAKVLVPESVYATLAQHPERVRECIAAAEQAMNETAAERNSVIRETPRLVDQRATGLGFFELHFMADVEKR